MKVLKIKNKESLCKNKYDMFNKKVHMHIQTAKSRHYNTNHPHDTQRSWGDWYYYYIYPYCNEGYDDVAYYILTVIIATLIVIGISIAYIYVTDTQEVLQEYHELFYNYSETAILGIVSTLTILYIYYKYKCWKENNSNTTYTKVFK